MDGDLRVDPDLLRDRAAELSQVARALATGGFGLSVAAADWSAGVGLAGLASAVSSALGSAAAGVAHSGDLLRAAAAGYEDADRRAASRLHRVG
ncbi:hypothetical protein AB0J74_08355 [Asanoa sp. NPDC049573]|uniref:hypothetical protein n=1 Tax=Asanoa sp. NPDC049573 TaxID=3155396 RepID=UPI00343DB9EE